MASQPQASRRLFDRLIAPLREINVSRALQPRLKCRRGGAFAPFPNGGEPESGRRKDAPRKLKLCLGDPSKKIALIKKFIS